MTSHQKRPYTVIKNINKRQNLRLVHKGLKLTKRRGEKNYRWLKILKHRRGSLTHSHADGSPTGNGTRENAKFIRVGKARLKI